MMANMTYNSPYSYNLTYNSPYSYEYGYGYTDHVWSCDEDYYVDNDTGNSEHTNGTVKHKLKWSSIFTMVTCVIGFIGNCFNLAVLIMKLRATKLQPLEFNASITLCALAISDLCFCALVFPHPLTDGYSYYYSSDQVYILYYRYYGHALVNLFLMSSTYMTVILAVERYIVMYYPLHAKLVLYRTTTIGAIFVFFILCACATLPYCFNMIVVPCISSKGETMYELLHRWPFNSTKYNVTTIYMTWIWPCLAVFLPLTLLFFCNVKLIFGLRRVHLLRRNSCPGQRVKAINHQITVILVIIISAAIILLTPAEVVKLINPYETWGKAGYVVAEVVNAMQTINFAFNFLLYCVLDKSFCKFLFPSYLCRRRIKNSAIECKDIIVKEPLRQGSTKAKSTQKSTLFNKTRRDTS